MFLTGAAGYLWFAGWQPLRAVLFHGWRQTFPTNFFMSCLVAVSVVQMITLAAGARAGWRRPGAGARSGGLRAATEVATELASASSRGVLRTHIKTTAMTVSRIAATIHGMNRERMDVPIAAAFSPVATRWFLAPAVSLLDPSRVKTLPPWMTAAAPPPTSLVVHFSMSLSTGKTQGCSANRVTKRWPTMPVAPTIPTLSLLFIGLATVVNRPGASQ